MTDTKEIAVMRRKATHMVSLEKRSVPTKMKRLPALIAGIGPKISTVRVFSGDVSRPSDIQFLARVVHVLIVFWISVTTDGQYNGRHMV